jgi:hypothetical protein
MHKIEPWFLVFNIFQPKTNFLHEITKKITKKCNVRFKQEDVKKNSDDT